RIPIVDGRLNFKDLERDLSLLENLVLDFVVRDGTLILEKNVPLIPFDNETLVYWPLAGEELELASRELVRLRTLLRWRLPFRENKPRAEDAFALTRVPLEEINARLRLGGPAALVLGERGVLTLGAEERAAIGSLKVTGAIRYAMSGSTDSTEVHI